MATSTTNLGLTKPAGTDKIRIAQINGNMDILDEKIGAVGNTSLQAQVTSQNEAISNIVSPTNYTNDILADALNVQGTKVFSGSGSVYTGTVPDNVYKYGVFTVYKRYSTYLVVAVGDNNHVAVNSYNTVWSGWQELAQKSETEIVYGTVSATGITFQTNDTYLIKIGHLVIMQLAFKPDTNISAWTTFFTIPEGFKPVKTLYAPDLYNYNADRHYEIYRTSGDVQASFAMDANAQRRTSSIVWYV